MDKQFASGLMWFRRDLRLDDNAALHAALRACGRLHCVFVFDTDLLSSLPRIDRRVEFIRESLQELDLLLREASGQPEGGLIVCHGCATQVLPALARELDVQAVFAAHDYEPYALERDCQVLGRLADAGITLQTCKDHVVVEGRELLTQAGNPYTVFTPYKKAWLARLAAMPLPSHDASAWYGRLAARPQAHRQPVPELTQLGFEPSNLGALRIPTGSSGAQTLFAEFFERMDDYDATRNFPAVKGPSYLGVHLRFGTISVRRLVAVAWQRQLQGSAGAAVWLSELVWREFYAQILANFPHVAERAFKPDYDNIVWEHGKAARDLFAAWCAGRTGYPLVDAAMAQINQTGYMHNRLRMVAASFLVKDLGIDWRWGERYFAEMLNDFDLSANNGGWQWVASSGCDAQPYFRIFNPVTQSLNFDPQGKFIRRYLPQLAALPDGQIHAPWSASGTTLQAAGVRLGDNYPAPLVAHDEARARTLARYAVVRQPAAAPKQGRTV